MKQFTNEQLRQAEQDATTYKEFRDNLAELVDHMPIAVGKFPHGMKGWKRKLRYEISQDPSFGTPTTGHDIRQKKYYERLLDLGHPNPENIMS